MAYTAQVGEVPMRHRRSLPPRPCVPFHARRSRRGVTMVEIAIVMAIIAVMAGLAGSYLNPMLPSWRTRRAASEFAGTLELARQRAMAEGVQYRVRIEVSDDDVSADTQSVGGWSIAGANPVGSAAEWDVLPLEDGDVDDIQGEGLRIFSADAEDPLPGVSLLSFGDPMPTDGAILFDTRGFLANGLDEFNENGTIAVVFANKAAARDGKQDEWTVCISRSGVVRSSPTGNPSCNGVFGTTTVTNMTVTNGTGFLGDGGSTFGSPDVSP